MADEKPEQKVDVPEQKTPPKTTDIVADNHQKQITELQKKIADNETTLQTMSAENKTMKEMFEKMSKLPAPTSSESPKPTRKSLLEHVTDIISGNF